MAIMKSLTTGVVLTKGTLTVKSIRKTWEKIQVDAKGCQEHHRTKESVIVTKSLRRGGGSRQDMLGARVVYVESKSLN